MRKLRLFWILLAVASLVGCRSFPGNLATEKDKSTPLASDSAISTGTLGNGMSWYVLKNPEPKNRIFIRLVVKAGSVLEDADQKGLAHLIEHMAFNGSEHFVKNDLINYFESIGMTFGPEVNAQTGFDETVFMLEIPADNPAILAKSLLVVRDWATGLTFDPVELKKERGVVLEE
jgi:zinc protease